MFTDHDLDVRGTATLIAAWEEYARGTPGATVRRLPGVVAAVFPRGPERQVYNNAVVERELDAPGRATAIEAMEAAYAAAGVASYAAWAHESDQALVSDLERRGFTFAESTRVMGMSVADVRVPRPELDLAAPDWATYLRVADIPEDLLAGVNQQAFPVVLARVDGEPASAAMAYDHAGDRGIYNVGTLPHARRRGLATALTAELVYDAIDRGLHTASLQSTELGERVYAAVGFRDLGRFLEYAPPQ